VKPDRKPAARFEQPRINLVLNQGANRCLYSLEAIKALTISAALKLPLN